MGDFARLRLGLAQINPVVGALEENCRQILIAYQSAVEADCDVVAFGELAVTGYPPEDLVLKEGFVTDNLAALAKLVESIGETFAVIGFVDRDAQTNQIYNAAAVCRRREIVGIYRKQILPNYDVFDEQRYFVAGGDNPLFSINGIPVGVTICEDIWQVDGPVAAQADHGAVLNLNINGSPFHAGKLAIRRELVSLAARDNQCAIAYVNQVGGQDELVFDGGSFVVAADGQVVASASQFAEQVLVCDLCLPKSREILQPNQTVGSTATELSELAQIHSALVIGTRDYVRKNGFSDVVVGLSGGIDSALVAAIATEALGASHVHCLAMPSRYSSPGSVDDAYLVASNLQIDIQTISIEPAFSAYLEMLAGTFSGRSTDLTEENLQSRVRGMTLMAVSNKFGWLVLTTGNKSELAVGYFTLYGDSVGGYGVIKDLFKTNVYRLCTYINQQAGKEIIPKSVIEKPPSAELRPNQRDDQSLPAYETLDPILELYLEQDRTVKDIVGLGNDHDLVTRITQLVDLNEYKRRQMPPGVRITTKAFGKDRRLPITNKYRG